VNQVEAFLPLVLVAIVGYLLLIRPVRRRAQAAQQLQSALSTGDEVMLTSGLFATVVDVQDEVVHVEVAPGTVVRVHRRAIGQIIRDVPQTGDTDGDAPRHAGDTPGEEQPGVN
jgi:preprotein translocase subunit YajC